jgi:flagellar assembly factor FliW
MKQEISFVREIPGFTGFTQFILESSEENAPFATLQSVEDDNVGFITANIFALFPEYQIELPEDIVTDLDVLEPNDVLIFGIITYKTSLIQSTMNLQAPVIVNIQNWKAAQIINSHPTYQVRQPLVPVTQSEVASSSEGLNEDIQRGGDTDARINSEKG